jgi:hypothetical protein
MSNKRVLSKVDLGKYKKSNPYSKDIIVDPRGQWDNPGEVTRIPGNDITMQGVDYPVWAQPNIGMPQMMYPDQDYNFPEADYVDEFPQMQEAKQGGALLTQTMTCGNCGWKWKAADGGSDVTTCHKCGGKAKINYKQGGESNYYEDDLDEAQIEELRAQGYIVEELPKAQKGITISDPKEYAYRNNMYNDSLNLYKAYQMQDKLMGSGSYKTKFKNKWNTAELKEGRKKKYIPSLKGYYARDFQSEEEQFKDGFDLWTARKEDKQLLDYYKKLGFKPNQIMYHSSPDVVSDKIKATGSYFDGEALSPIYKKPVQPIYKNGELKNTTVAKPIGTLDPKKSINVNLIKQGFATDTKSANEFKKKLWAEVNPDTPYKATDNAAQNNKLNKWIFDNEDKLSVFKETGSLVEKKESMPETQELELTPLPTRPLQTRPLVKESTPGTVKPPASTLEWVKHPQTGTWYQIQRAVKPEDLPEYNLNTGSYLQDGGKTDAMTGMMKARLAYANEFGNPAAKRMINLPDNPYQFDNGDIGTHYMASYDNYAVPQIQDENGELVLGDYGPESNEAIRFDSDEDANYFAEHYKDVSPAFINAELTDHEIQEYIDGGYIVEEISVPELQNGGEETQLNLDLPAVTVYANEPKRKLQGSLIDKLAQVKNAYQNYRENAGLTKLRLKNEGVSSTEALKRNIKEYKSQLEEEKKSFDRAQKALNVLQKKDPKAWKNKKLKDVMSAQGVDALRFLYKEGKISNESFMDFYNNFGKQFDREAVKTSAEDQVKLEDSWYGKKDEQGRRRWMSNPMNVAKVAQGVAAAAALGPGAVASGIAAPVGYVLSNPLVQAGLTGYGVYDATTNTLPEAYRDFSEGRYLEGLGNVGMAALDLAPIPLFGTNLLDEASQAGKFLTQGPLKNAYKYNSFANKEVPMNKLFHGSNNPNLSLDDIKFTEFNPNVGPRPGQFKRRAIKSGDPLEMPGGFYTNDRSVPSFMGNNDYRYSMDVPANAKVFKWETGPSDNISVRRLQELKNKGYDVIQGKNIVGETEYIPLNKDLINNWKMYQNEASELELLKDSNFETITPHWLKGYPKVPKQLPGSPNVVSSVDDVVKQPWQIQEIPGLHLKSTMEGEAISKIVEPKTGLINTEQALAIIGKESGGKEKADLIRQALGENVPKKMDFNDFRKTVQDQLIPLERQFSTGRSAYGVDRLGYNLDKGSKIKLTDVSPEEYIPEIEEWLKVKPTTKGVKFKSIKDTFEGQGTLKVTGIKPNGEKFTWVVAKSDLPSFASRNPSDIIENQTLILGNKNKFGRGSSAHGNPDETLGHAHYLIDKESPNVLTVTQIQSDAFQGTHRRMPTGKLNKTGEPIEFDYQGNPIDNDYIDEVGKYFDEATGKNITQKFLLDKNHQERYLQELVDYAGKRGDVNKVRVPTSETAAKVQGYNTKKSWNVSLRDGDEVVLLDGTKGKVTDDLFNNSVEITTVDGKKINIDMSDAGYSNSKKLPLKSVNSTELKELSSYNQEEMTILKKYSEQPKRIKKLFGVEPKVVTDSKGNTWYEFDIPKSFKSGTGEIKAFKEGGAIEIELTDDEIEQYINAGYTVEEVPEYAPGGVVDMNPAIMAKYLAELKLQENAGKVGFKNGKFYPHASAEKGKDTIGYGHKLTGKNDKYYYQGLTPKQVEDLTIKDILSKQASAKKHVDDIYGQNTFDKLPQESQMLLTDYQYNVDLSKFPKFLDATVKGDKAGMLDEYERSYSGGKLKKRNDWTKGVITNIDYTPKKKCKPKAKISKPVKKEYGLPYKEAKLIKFTT